MSDYYGVTRSDEHLAHYGIKGMKWGVQKAKYNHNDRALSRHFNKAQKKIQKYEDLMDANKQKQAAEYHKRKGIRYGILGTALAIPAGAGIGGAVNSWHAQPKPEGPNIGAFTYDPNTGQTVYRQISGGKKIQSNKTKALGVLGAASAIGSIAANSKATYHAIEANKAKWRSTPAGHKEAVRKYAPKVAEWKREMQKSFAGTPYANEIRKASKKKVKHSDLEDPNSLAHYGIKGMKWGVRKAIESGNDRRLGRHYQNAMLKLHELDKKANREHQRKIYKNAKRNMLVGSLGSAIGSAGLTAAMGGGPLYSAIAGGVGGLAGLAMNTNGISARRNLSDKGHARAVAKRDAWKKEMNSAFKKTRFNSKNMSKGKAAAAVRTQKELYDASYNGGAIGALDYYHKNKAAVQNLNDFYRNPRYKRR